MKQIVLVKRFSVQKCKKYKNVIFIFGDNLVRKGTGGQACIRHCGNSFGIPTKRKPSMTKNSFFSDKKDEFEAIDLALKELEDMLIDGRNIALPLDGLGTGMVAMKEKSPNCFEYLNEKLLRLIKKYK